MRLKCQGQVPPCAMCFKVMIRLQVGREAGKRREGERERTENSPEQLEGVQFPEQFRKGGLLFVSSASKNVICQTFCYNNICISIQQTKCTSTLEEWAATIVFTLLPFCKLIGVKMLSCLCMRAKSVQSCPTLCSPMDCSPPGSSIHGIFQVRILEWVAMPSSKRSCDPGIKPMSQVSCISRRVLGH